MSLSESPTVLTASHCRHYDGITAYTCGLKALGPDLILGPIVENESLERADLFLGSACSVLRAVHREDEYVFVYDVFDEGPCEVDKEFKRRIIFSRSELKRDELQPSPIPITCAIICFSSGSASMYIPHRH